VKAAVNLEQLRGAKKELEAIIRSTSANPIFVRLGWHDAGTFDKNAPPGTNGARGTIRFNPEISHGANAGLQGALDLAEPVKAKFPDVSYADLYQLASAVAIEVAGGPVIPMRYGRKDGAGPDACAPEGNLPAAAGPFPDGSPTPGAHLKRVFYRMGLNDQDIVALSGAHTLGRSRPERSGFGVSETKYTRAGPGKPGGQSWTVEWLKFDNSYFVEVKTKRDEDLLVLPTDAALFEDDDFRPYAEKYAADQDAFFADYVTSHLKLSELGVTWEEGGPVTLDGVKTTAGAAA